jgi:hypothetical protein
MKGLNMEIKRSVADEFKKRTDAMGVACSVENFRVLLDEFSQLAYEAGESMHSAYEAAEEFFSRPYVAPAERETRLTKFDKVGEAMAYLENENLAFAFRSTDGHAISASYTHDGMSLVAIIYETCNGVEVEYVNEPDELPVCAPPVESFPPDRHGTLCLQYGDALAFVAEKMEGNAFGLMEIPPKENHNMAYLVTIEAGPSWVIYQPSKVGYWVVTPDDDYPTPE